MWHLFGRSRKVSPSPIPSDTFYLCEPESGEFYIQDVLLKFSLAMAQEQEILVSLKEQIEDITEEMEEYHRVLMEKTFAPIQKRILALLNDSIKKLGQIEIDKANLEKKAVAFIPMENYYRSEVQALNAGMRKYPDKNTLTLIKLVIPKEKFNVDWIKDKEISRPNLLAVVETVKSVPLSDVGKLKNAKEAISKEKISKSDKQSKIEAATARIAQEMINNASEYKKSVIMNTRPTVERKTSNPRKPSFLNRVHVMPTIQEALEEKYFQIFRINPEVSVVFEETKRGGKNLKTAELPSEIRKP